VFVDGSAVLPVRTGTQIMFTLALCQALLLCHELAAYLHIAKVMMTKADHLAVLIKRAVHVEIGLYIYRKCKSYTLCNPLSYYKNGANQDE
jgi:hypothetical protein